jgi:hypothetical protein
MRLTSPVFASFLLLGAPLAFGASETPEQEVSLEVEQALPEATGDAGPETSTPSAGVTLGPIGYDERGQQGRLHVVVSGDTLWDVSEAYLGTPWVWPSVWQDNQDIENPHLIRPGDRIWITRTEMRRVSEQEAARLLAGTPANQDVPASFEDDSGASLEPVAVPVTFPFHRMEAMGLVTAEQVEAASSIVDSPHDRVWFAQHDTVFVGLGQGEAREGEEFTIFRTASKVIHPETGQLFGYHVDVLGWARVTEPGPETSVAKIEQSYAEMRRGDRVLPRPRIDPEIEVRPARAPVEGFIVFTPELRTQMASADVVYLDRGALDGLEVGNPLEVYRPGRPVNDVERESQVETPDWVIARLLVVAAREDSAVALVTHSTKELERGDLFRTATD